MEVKEKLYGKTLNELNKIVQDLGFPKYTSAQIANWLYKKNIDKIDDMSNLSVKSRSILSEKYIIGKSAPDSSQVSADGTKKYLYKALDNKYIEAAYIPEKNRNTLCISSQVGCKMGCLFCMTGKQGFHGNLCSGDILNQISSLPEREELTNIVYMGMGEPLDNTEEVLKSLEILTSEWGYAMSPRRITVSTIGILPGLKLFLEKSECHLAISLHTPFDEERKALMPIEKIYPVKDVLKEIKKYNWRGQRRVSMEYIMFKDLNDTNRHIEELSRILKGIKCRLNLIRFHAIPDTALKGTTPDRMEEFRDRLNEKGIIATIRRSRGEDILAACGLLSTKTLMQKKD